MSTSVWKAEALESRNAASSGAFTQALGAVLDRLLWEIRRRRTYAALSALNDSTLKDIGLDRGMLLGVANGLSLNSAREPRPTWAERGGWHRIREQGAKLLSGLAGIVFEARKRAAARDLRRFEAALGPNQMKELGQRINDLPFHRPN